jgi:hypothetical protein
MPSKTFALEKGGPERLEIEWQGNFRDLEIRLDGALLGGFENAKELKAGKSFGLEPEGGLLEVKLGTNGLLPELTLSLNGHPLPGSAADPAQRVEAAANMVLVVAVLNAGLGLLAAAFDIGFLQSIGVGLGSIVVGAIYGVLGYFVKRRSLAALALAVALFVLDGVSLLFVTTPSGTPPIGGLVARVFFLIPMVLGFPALRALRAEEERGRRAPRARPARPAGAAPAPGSTASPDSAVPPKAAAAAPTRTLTGDAERLRLDLSRTAGGAAARTAPSGRRIETRTRSDVDAAAEGLRFVARKCEITPIGLKVHWPDGRAQEVSYADIRAVVVRTLPPDAPWNAQPLLDAVFASLDGAGWSAIRVFSTTMLNAAALPGGASTSRLENMRRLAAHLAAQNPSVALDPESAAFVKDGRPPGRFVGTGHFAEYDQRYR